MPKLRFKNIVYSLNCLSHHPQLQVFKGSQKRLKNQYKNIRVKIFQNSLIKNCNTTIFTFFIIFFFIMKVHNEKRKTIYTYLHLFRKL